VSVSIVPGAQVSVEDVDYIIANMRSEDKHEVMSVGANMRHAFALYNHATQDCQVAYLNDEPVFVFGSRSSWPHVRGIFGFGTDKTTRVIPEMTRWINAVWKPRVFNELGALRIEVRLPLSCDHSINWLSKLGMKRECEIDGFSITGERYVQLSYTKDDFECALNG
jgi:hypothetical protein